MRNALIAAIAVVAVIILLISVYLTPNDLAKCGDAPSTRSSCQKADAIVAVSGGNTSVRAAEAIQLYKAGWADTLVFSGAARDEASPSNAEVMRRQALAAGVPPDAIVTESIARTTKQNAENTRQVLFSRGIRRVILVTSAYHQRRAGLEFRAYAGDSLAILNRPATNDPDWSRLWWLTPRGWWLAIGELIKIIAFYSGQSQ